MPEDIPIVASLATRFFGLVAASFATRPYTTAKTTMIPVDTGFDAIFPSVFKKISIVCLQVYSMKLL
jgi:hypothetical protein